jgi:beta-N-acetylhexosaminidase
MTAHVLFKDLDSRPATYSKKILHDIVRRDWQYKGLLVADDVGMQAVRKEFLNGNATAEAIGAGCDFLIASRHPHQDGVDDFEASISRLADLGRSGAVDNELRDSSKTRIQKVLDGLPAFRTPTMLEEEVLGEHERLRASLDGWFFGKSPPD